MAEKASLKDNAKSPVWDRFGFKAAEDGKAVEDGKPICLHCKRSVASRWGNTYVTKHNAQNLMMDCKLVLLVGI